MNREKFIQSLEQIKTLTEECLLEISDKVKLKTTRERGHQTSFSGKVDFDMSERAFIKKYSKGMSGHKKFVLILTYLVKGKIGEEKLVGEIKKHWNKMTTLLGGEFNAYYSTTAKDNNWVDSKNYGFWFLTKHWKEIFLT
ncbi:MAG: hypothetical protein Q8N88_05075 [Nanoarchaeota archaeon]|nr:hypothetical protein [Nanoarchaeota archaeon]